VTAKAATIAAHLLNVTADGLEFVNGRFRVREALGRALSIQELAFAAFKANDLPKGVEPMLEATAFWDPPNFTFPFGTHISVVEVDTETGVVQVVKYVAVDDCGNAVNPAIVEGQTHGGVTQGLGQALYEEAVYDEHGQLVWPMPGGYPIPTAAKIPSYVCSRTVTPTESNPLGAKGIGQTGAIASTPAVVNAVIDALSPFGVSHIDMPCTPGKVWKAIHHDGR
jgi:carbon-monoxide dehydrogenase large subunit